MERHSYFVEICLLAVIAHNWLDDCHLPGKKGKVRDLSLRLHSHSGSNRMEVRLNVVMIVMLEFPRWGLNFSVTNDSNSNCYLIPLLIVCWIKSNVFLVLRAGLSQKEFINDWWFKMSCWHAMGLVRRLVLLLSLKEDIDSCIDLNEYPAEAMLWVVHLLLRQTPYLFLDVLSHFRSLG